MIEAPQPWPMALAWFPPETPNLNVAICDRASLDIMMCEKPRGSNSGGRIDEYNRRAGAPLKSYWCASAATAWYVDAGADVPENGRASCQVLMEWAKKEELWSPAPIVGAMVIYGTPDGSGGWKPNDAGHLAHHVGVVVRTDPYVCSFEGNAAYSGFSSNGEAVLGKFVEEARVLGYIHPRARKA